MKRGGRNSSSRDFRTGPRASRPSDVYGELLEEALLHSLPDGNRPLKKRKSQRGPSETIVIDDASPVADEPTRKNERDVVLIESSSNDVSEDDDEMEWDTVDLNAGPLSEHVTDSQTSPVIRDITLVAPLQKSTSAHDNACQRRGKKRAPTAPRNAITREIRLQAHKMHLLCLLAAFRHLNDLLSSPALHKVLRRYVAPATINALNAGPEHTQARRTIAFISGLKDLVSLWSTKWTETKRGWRRPRWVDAEDLGKIPAHLDLNESISLESLMNCAMERSGSRDVGAWLFTALLRSVGVEARLVCSLQPLQFGFLNEGPKQDFHAFPDPAPIEQDKGHAGISSVDTSPHTQSHRPTVRNPAFPSSATRKTGVYTSPAQYIAQTKTYSPNHPFFWTEAWEVASQKWIAVEALIGAHVNRPSLIEPPISTVVLESAVIGDNTLTYAIGFDNSGFVKDVTRRYAKAYHSKTWKIRIESQGQERWWTRIMKFLDRMEPLDRDQVEGIDLANHVLKEPVPKKIDDFQHHPLYVLERHLRRNEKLVPEAVHVSTLTSGKGVNMKTEHVYKRKDVVNCYSARDWFRRGRIIKEGEQPIKHAVARRRRRALSSDEEEEEDTSTALYSEKQTEIYVPLPVENGIVPKNAFGNIDVYTPTMVPEGGVHLTQPSIAIAAQFAGVDYSDAVIGFDFVRNRATPRLNGVVVAKENVEGLLEVWEGMMERVRGEEERLRRQSVLERWRRFILALEIKARLDETHGKLGERDVSPYEESNENTGFHGVVRDSAAAASDHQLRLRPRLEDNLKQEKEIAVMKPVPAMTNVAENQESQSYIDQVNSRTDDEGGGFIVNDTEILETVEDGNESDTSGGFEEDDDESDGGFIYADEDGIM